MVTKTERNNHTKKVFDLALNAFCRADEEIEDFLSRKSLPAPLDCKPECHYCCYNIPVVTQPEVLLIGHHVDQTYTEGEKEALMIRIETVLAKIAGLRPDEIVMMRHELPCIFLTKNRCAIYSLRPIVCRTCSSISSDHCKKIFETGNHRSRLLCYQQIREIFFTVHSQLVKSCKEMGCRSDTMGLAEAMENYFNHSYPVDE